MFETDLDIVQSLLDSNDSFKQLYDEHNVLKAKVHDAEIGTLPLDDATLGILKKEKLLTKDKMAVMIEEYRKVHA